MSAQFSTGWGMPSNGSSNVQAAPGARSAGAILREQFGYLLNHSIVAGPECPPDCGECRRLRQIQEILMEPFRSERHPTNVWAMQPPIGR